MKKLNLALAGVLMASAAVTMTACGKKKADKVVIGFTYYAPIAYEEGGKLIGFDIELAKATFASIDKKYSTTTEIEFQEIEWSAKEALLANGTIDLVWNGLTITDERKANMEISTAYLANNQVVVTKKANATKYADKNELKNAVIGVEDGSAGEDAAEGNNKEVIKYTSQLDALTQLNNGTVDAVIIDSVMAGYYTSTGTFKDTLATVTDYVLLEEEFGIAAKKGNTELMNKVNEALKAIKDTDMKTIAEKYGVSSLILVK